MSSIEDRVKTLEQLLMTVLSNMGDTRSAISDGFKKTNDNFIKIHEKIDTLSGNTKRGFQDVSLDLASICSRKEGIQSFWQLAIQNIRQECCRIIGKNECRARSKVWY